jgi:anti-sigma B factor antagonist
MKIMAGICKGVPILRIKTERIDGATAPEFRKALSDLGGRGLTSFVIDLSGVGFIDSTGLGALVSAFKATGRAGGVVVSGANQSIATLFRITRMDKVFRLFATDIEAAAAVSSLPPAAPGTLGGKAVP